VSAEGSGGARAEVERIDRIVSALDAFLFGDQPELVEALARIEVLAVDRRDLVRDAWREVADAWEVVRGAVPTIAARAAWRMGRAELRRARRLSSKTLPALGDVAQRLVLAREAIDRLATRVPPDGYADLIAARDHVVEALRPLATSPSEPPSRADD
jgi:hypothetical protein